MTVTSSLGAFGWGRQTGKGSVASIEYWHRAHNIDFGVVESREVLDPEVGGTTLPAGVIKTGAHVAGGVDISPRLEDNIGWLFHAMLGACYTTAADGDDRVKHEFRFAADESDTQWITLAKWMPGSTATEDIGLRVTDARVAAMRLMLPGRGRVRMRLEFLGITPEYIADPASNASWATSFEEEDSIPITAVPADEFKIGTPAEGHALTTVYPLGCVVDFTNGLSDPIRQEAVIGKYFPDDLHVLGRAVIVRFPLKISTYDYFAIAVLNQPDASALSTFTAWSPVTFSSEWSVKVASPGNISGLTNPYGLDIYAKEVEWVVDPIRLMGNEQVLVNFTGTVVKPASGTSFKTTLFNEVASYVWPTP